MPTGCLSYPAWASGHRSVPSSRRARRFGLHARSCGARGREPGNKPGRPRLAGDVPDKRRLYSLASLTRQLSAHCTTATSSALSPQAFLIWLGWWSSANKRAYRSSAFSRRRCRAHLKRSTSAFPSATPCPRRHARDDDARALHLRTGAGVVPGTNWRLSSDRLAVVSTWLDWVLRRSGVVVFENAVTFASARSRRRELVAMSVSTHLQRNATRRRPTTTAPRSRASSRSTRRTPTRVVYVAKRPCKIVG